jgi:hypothetical protein
MELMLHKLIAGNVIRYTTMRWAGKVARMGERRNEYHACVGILEGKGPRGSL